jgi:two-component sensor histidine kinase
MAEAIRTFDWWATYLGPFERWPTELRTIVNLMLESDFPKAILWGPSLITLHNDAFLTILGNKAPALGKPFSEVWTEAWPVIGPIAERAFAGESTFIENFPLVINRSGVAEEAFFTFCYSPIRNDEGNVVGIMDTVVETTTAMRAHQAETVLRRELVHRVKNIMAVMGAVVSASLRQAETLEQAQSSITARIEALSRAQGLLAQPEEHTDLATVIEAALAPFKQGLGRVTVGGPPVRLAAQEAVAISLALYELATNAAKYGALSAESGKVSVAWERSEDGQFVFRWTETDGPPILTHPSRKGFGSRLTNRIVPAYFNGQADTIFAPDGLRYELRGIQSPLSSASIQ